jgi:hypothetical protein
MTRLSESSLETIRTRPQRTQLYLSIFQPRVVFQAQINDMAVKRGSRIIAYDSVTLGSYLDIEENFLMLIGTTVGARDIGTIRVRSANVSQITVSENSNISWATGLFISVLRYVRLDPIYPRIIKNPSNDEDVIFYKDYDISYVAQNTILGTFPCAGNHQALFRGEQVYYSSTGTSNLIGDSLSFEWEFEGGTPTGSTSRDPGYVTYNNTGQFVTRMSVSSSSGEVDTTYRYASVYDRPGEGANTPISLWELKSLNGSRDEGGYSASFVVHEDVPIEENSIVVLFSENWYGSTKQSFGGNSPNNERIFFVGHVLQGSIRKNYQRSYIEFSVGSVTEVMKQALGFSVSVESKSSPQTWYELWDMDCRRAIYHYLKWHSTALSIADFRFLGDDRKIQFFDADRTSMYDAIDNLMRNTLIGKVVSDRQGSVWMEVDAQAYSNPTGSFSSIMDIAKRDWMGEPVIDQEFSDKISYLEMGGIAYSGVSTGTYSAILASAPGSAPSFRGNLETIEGLALLGQSQLNELVGNVFANKNSRLPKTSMDMTGNYPNLDIAPQESVRMTILPSDTIEGIPVDGLYIPNGIDWQHDPSKQFLASRIDFVNLVSGEPGETIEIAHSAEESGFDSGFKIPQLQIPPIPLLTTPAGSAATGSSCCDYFAGLGIGLGVFSGVFTRDRQIDNSALSQQHFGYDYASNPAMYDSSTGQILLINTGTVTYEVDISVSWRQLQDPVAPYTIPGGVRSTLNVGFFGTYFSFSIGQQQYNGIGTVDVISSGAGDSGTIVKSQTFNESTLKYPYKISSYVEETYDPHSFNLVGWSLIKVTVKGTP